MSFHPVLLTVPVIIAGDIPFNIFLSFTASERAPYITAVWKTSRSRFRHIFLRYAFFSTMKKLPPPAHESSFHRSRSSTEWRKSCQYTPLSWPHRASLIIPVRFKLCKIHRYFPHQFKPHQNRPLSAGSHIGHPPHPHVPPTYLPATSQQICAQCAE